MAQTVKRGIRHQPTTGESTVINPQALLRPVVTEVLLADIANRIVQSCDPEKVILFGSYAYGTPHSDSDVDLFVIMKPKYAEETNHERIMNVRAVAKVKLLPM